MPIYEYRCQQCGTTLEAMQRMSDPPLKRCERCGADALERLISQTSFVLKGSGWYVTDYKSRPAEAKKDGGEATTAKADPPKADAPKADASPAKASAKSD